MNNIDGLPGITPQGKQGGTGMRGCGTFGAEFSINNNTRLNGKISLGIISLLTQENDLKDSFTENYNTSTTSGNKTTIHIAVIYTNDEIPIKNDYVIVNRADTTYLCRVAGYVIDPSKEGDDKIVDVDIYKKSKNVIMDMFPDQDYMDTYCVKLSIIDSWEYKDDINTETIDFTVNVEEDTLKNTNGWTGDYGEVSLLEGGDRHTFHLIDRSNMGGRILAMKMSTDPLTSIDGGEEFYINLEVKDALTLEPIDSATMKVYYTYPDSGVCREITTDQPVPISSFISQKTPEGSEYTYTARYVEVYAADAGYIYAACEINNRHLLGNTLTVYMWKNSYINDITLNFKIDEDNTIGNTIANNDTFVIHDRLRFYNSAWPITGGMAWDEKAKTYYSIGDATTEETVYKFKVFNSMNPDDMKKVKIEAYFTKASGLNFYAMDSVRYNLWNKEGDISNWGTQPSATYKKYNRYGYAYNFTNDLTFDSEAPERFSITIKEYDQGNNVKTFDPGVYIPVSVAKNYSIYIYAYIRQSASASKKILIGSIIPSESNKDDEIIETPII